MRDSMRDDEDDNSDDGDWSKKIWSIKKARRKKAWLIGEELRSNVGCTNQLPLVTWNLRVTLLRLHKSLPISSKRSQFIDELFVKSKVWKKVKNTAFCVRTKQIAGTVEEFTFRKGDTGGRYTSLCTPKDYVAKIILPYRHISHLLFTVISYGSRTETENAIVHTAVSWSSNQNACIAYSLKVHSYSSYG